MKRCATTLTRNLTAAVLALTLAVPASAAGNAPAEGTAQGLALFKTQVRTILTARCLKCHGGQKVKGQFNLSTREGLLKGAKHGSVVVPYSSDGSRIMGIVQKTKKPGMPPKEFLPMDDITALRKWIDQGAPYDAPLK